MMIEKMIASLSMEDATILRDMVQRHINQMNNNSCLTLTEEEIQFIKAGQRVQAIKSVRARFNLGLKEAKDFVDREMPPRSPIFHGQVDK